MNPLYPYWEFEPFCLDSLDSSGCKSQFTLEKDDIPIVADAVAAGSHVVVFFLHFPTSLDRYRFCLCEVT